ncbi:MAG: AsmA family protein [Candidatus Omnitrophica bacterium]|jgi:hypothetical protein|nr:AsmA family protein [Candidatus Omnitrophota bacterium]
MNIKRMIKVVLIALSIIILIFFIVVVIFLSTFDANRFKPQIIAAAQKALGRPLDLANINLKLSLRDGIQLRISDIIIKEHPDFGQDNFLSTKEANLGLSVKDLILKRQIRILGVEIKTPQISIIRLKDGRINIQTLAKVSPDKQQGIETSLPKLPSEATSKELPQIFINRIDIENGRIDYRDYLLEPNISLILDKIALQIDDFSLTKPFLIKLQALFASNSQNIFAQGEGQINMVNSSFLLKEVRATSDLSSLSMDMLSQFIPQLKNASLPKIKSGVLSINIDSLEAGSKGLNNLKGQVVLTKGLLQIKELAVPIESIEATVDMSEDTIILDKASCLLGKGKVEFSGNISDYLVNQNYSLKVNLEDLELSEVIDQVKYPVKVKGLIFGDIEVKGQGFDPNGALAKLNGNGSLQIKEGQLIDINVFKMVLDKLSFMPNLAAVLEANLPERFKENLRKKDTTITNCKTTLGIGNNSIAVESIDVETETFLFQGKGLVSFDQSYSLDGSFMIPQDLSSSITTTVPEMEYLLNETKQIYFPLKVSGKGAKVSFMPDVKQIGMSAIKQKGRQELEKVLDKFLDQDSSTADNVEESSPDADKKSGKEQLIDSLIGTIFKE